MSTAALLARTRFFEGVSPESLSSLAAICQPRSTERREMLFREGEPGEHLFVVAVGEVRLFRTGEEGREAVIKLCPPGEVFGEVILFEAARYPVSAEVLQPGLVHAIRREDFRRLLDVSGFRDDFLAMLMRKQRYLVGKVQQLVSSDVEGRLFAFLRERFGAQERIETDLSKKDVAGALGTIPETFSRLLLRLRQEGTLTWEGRIIELRPGFWSGP